MSVAVLVVLLTLGAFAALAPPARAAGSPCDDPDCAAHTLRASLSDDTPDVSLALAKDAAAAWPDDPRFPLLLAAAYLRADNPTWALRTLTRRLDAAPDDCAARLWLAWTKASLGRFANLVPLLDVPACTPDDAEGTRALLVRALGHHHAHAADLARADLARARAQTHVYPEDRAALAALTAAADPARPDALAWRVDAAAGYASNPLLGAPNDPVLAAAAAGSPLTELHGWLRVAPELPLPLRPVLEVEARVLRYLDPDAAPLSTLGLAGRAGLLWGRGFPRLQLAWRPDAVLLDQGDAYAPGPLWTYAAHRGEFELELSEHLLVFGGAGPRTFRELGRGRVEVDLGAGGAAPLGAGLGLAWAVTARAHAAHDAAYDLVGGSAVASASGPLGLAALWGRLNVGVSVDAYPRSDGAFGVPEARRDVSLRAGAQLGLRLSPTVRAVVAYDLSWRDSTAPAYAATDHRVTLRLLAQGRAELDAPATATAPSLAPFAWGLDAADGADGERVQDLLRQDEQVRPSCGCGG